MDVPRALHEAPIFWVAAFKKVRIPNKRVTLGFLKNPRGQSIERAGFPALSLLAEPFDMRFPAPTQCRMVWVATLLSATC